MNTNIQNTNPMTASAAALNAQTYGTETQKSHTRSAHGSTIKMIEEKVEEAISTITRLYGKFANILFVDCDENGGIDIMFKDANDRLREYWKPANATRYTIYNHK